MKITFTLENKSKFVYWYFKESNMIRATLPNQTSTEERIVNSEDEVVDYIGIELATHFGKSWPVIK